MRKQPSASKHQKQFKGGGGRRVCRGVEHGSRKRGEYGLMAIERGRVTAQQREAGRKERRRGIERLGKAWICVYPGVPVSKKPLEVRMGKGKGSVEFWAVHVYPGMIRFEVRGVSEKISVASLAQAGRKIPMASKRVRRGR